MFLQPALMLVVAKSKKIWAVEEVKEAEVDRAWFHWEMRSVIAQIQRLVGVRGLMTKQLLTLL